MNGRLECEASYPAFAWRDPNLLIVFIFYSSDFKNALLIFCPAQTVRLVRHVPWSSQDCDALEFDEVY